MVNKSDYRDYLRSLADTILYEEAQKIVRQTETDKNSPAEGCHWMNGLVYSEFARREKHSIYYMAFNNMQDQLNRPKAKIN